MDVVSAITQDHRVLDELFARVEQEPEQRQQLMEEIAARLSAHSVAEEIHVYPELERKSQDESEQVSHGVDEHRDAEEKLVAAQAATDAEFTVAFKQFVEAIRHHVDEEETELLPALTEASTPARLNQLGDDFEQRRLAELEDWNHPDT